MKNSFLKLTPTLLFVCLSLLTTNCEKAEELKASTGSSEEISQWETAIPLSEYYASSPQIQKDVVSLTENISSTQIERECREFIDGIQALERGNKAVGTDETPASFVWKAEAIITAEEGNLDQPLYKPDGKYTQFTIPLKSTPNGKVISHGKVVSTYQKIKKFARDQVSGAGNGHILWAVDLILLEQNDNNIVVGVIVLHSQIATQVVTSLPPQFPQGTQLRSCISGDCISGSNTGGPDPLQVQIEERLNWTIPLKDQSNDIYINMHVAVIYSASSNYVNQNNMLLTFCQGLRLWCGPSSTSCLDATTSNHYLNEAYYTADEFRQTLANQNVWELAKVDMQYAGIFDPTNGGSWEYSHIEALYIAERFTPNNPIGFD